MAYPYPGSEFLLFSLQFVRLSVFCCYVFPLLSLFTDCPLRTNLRRLLQVLAINMLSVPGRERSA